MLFRSCGAAAKYIVDEEAKVDSYKSKATISKELRKHANGTRGNWVMYDKYTIGY